MKDRGLQPERTAMAWSRTALSALVCAVVYLKLALRGDHWLLGMAGGVLLIGALGLQWMASRRRRQLVESQPPAAPASRVLAMVVAIVIVGAAVAALTALA